MKIIETVVKNNSKLSKLFKNGFRIPITIDIIKYTPIMIMLLNILVQTIKAIAQIGFVTM
jgi:hypothetical protein